MQPASAGRRTRSSGDRALITDTAWDYRTETNNIYRPSVVNSVGSEVMFYESKMAATPHTDLVQTSLLFIHFVLLNSKEFLILICELVNFKAFSHYFL